MVAKRKYSSKFILCLGWGLSLGLASGLIAQTPATQQPGKEVGQEKKPDGLKRVIFEKREEPWDKVFEWLSQTSGLPLQTNVKPQGTFSIIVPEKKQFTIPEVIDFLNTKLLSEKPVASLIVRGADALWVIPADEPGAMDVTNVPTLTIADLEVDKAYGEQKYGKTELAKVNFVIKNMTLDEAEASIAQSLTSFKRITKITKTNTITVLDTVRSLREVKRTLDTVDQVADQFMTIPLGSLDGKLTLERLNKFFGAGPGTTTKSPIFEYEDLKNKILVKGTTEEVLKAVNMVRSIRELPPVKTLEEANAPPRNVKPFEPGTNNQSGNVQDQATFADSIRVVNTRKVNPVNASQNLTFLLSELRANPIVDQVLYQQMEEKLNQARKAPPASTKNATASTLIDPQSKEVKNKKPLPGDATKPIFLAPIIRDGNYSIMVGTDDAEAMQLVIALVENITDGAELGSQEVIPLKRANAVEAAKVLDEFLNGKRQQGGGMGFPIMMPGMGGGGRNEAAANAPRVVAETRSNSLLVKAPKNELVTIRRFVEQHIDVENLESEMKMTPYRITLFNATASEMSTLIKELYKEYVTARPAGGGGANPFNPFQPPQQRVDDTRSIKLEVTSDDKTNTLFIRCPSLLYKELEPVVKQIDLESADATRKIEVISTNGLDPALVEKALATLTGQTNNRNTNDPNAAGNRMGNFPFMGGGFPFGGGGGNQGGGNRMGGGGGGRPGGGGAAGGRGAGGGRGRSERAPERPGIIRPASYGGPDFFEGRVTEDPRNQVVPVLYNPRHDPDHIIYQDPAKAQEEKEKLNNQQPPAAQQPNNVQPQDDQRPKATRQPLSYAVNPDTGQIILIGDPEDIKQVKELLATLSKEAKPSDIELKLFPVKNLDPTTMASLLNQIYSRFNVTGSGIQRTTTTTPAAPANPLAALFGGGNQQQAGASAQSVLILPVPRLNSVLIGAPKNRLDDFEKTIALLDKPASVGGMPTTIKLNKAKATDVATFLTNFFNQRYPSETQSQNQVRIQAETITNSLIVQAGEADLKTINELITFFETNAPKKTNELHLIKLRNALASDVSTLIRQVLTDAIRPPLFSGTGGTTPGGGGNPFGGQQGGNPFGGNQFNPFGGGGQQGGPFGANRFGNQAGQQAGQTTPGASTLQSVRPTNLKFVPAAGSKSPVVEAAVAEEIDLLPEIRSNSILLSSPPQAVELIKTLIAELDVLPSQVAEIKVFKLNKADANGVAQTLQTVFLAQIGAARAGQGNQAQANVGAFGGFLGGNQNQNQNQSTRPTFATMDGISTVDPRVGVDTRTNSLIVAANRGEMPLIEAVILKLDSMEMRDRKFETYRLRNIRSGQAVTALQSFMTSEQNILTTSTELTAFLRSDRDVSIFAEETTNQLLIGASPAFLPEILAFIKKIDAELPQVMIQVLIAEIVLDNFDEFGVELGFQTPILFSRGLTSTGTIDNNATNLVGPGGSSGYNFANTNPLSNRTVADSRQVGISTITPLGVGRGGANGVGGFVFSAASDTVNVLVRALRTQGKAEILSRPMIMTQDNQTASINVGQQIPIITGTIVTTGIVQPQIEYRDVGIILQVTPTINPEGQVVIRVAPTVSSLSNSTVALGNGFNAPIINNTTAATTVTAWDSQTVAIGGLITKIDDKQQRSVPWLGDLPYLGSLFRYRSHTKQKRELLILLTPHVVRNMQDGYRVAEMEYKKMDWVESNIESIHGPIRFNSGLNQMNNGMFPMNQGGYCPPDQQGMPYMQPGVQYQQQPGMYAPMPGQPVYTNQPPMQNQMAPSTSPGIPPTWMNAPQYVPPPGSGATNLLPPGSSVPVMPNSNAPVLTPNNNGGQLPMPSNVPPGQTNPPGMVIPSGGNGSSIQMQPLIPANYVPPTTNNSNFRGATDANPFVNGGLPVKYENGKSVTTVSYPGMNKPNQNNNQQQQYYSNTPRQ